MGSPWRNAKQQVEALRQQGCEITLGGNCHLRVTYRGRLVGTLGGTPSDVRSHKNSMSHIRRNIRALEGGETCPTSRPSPTPTAKSAGRAATTGA